MTGNTATLTELTELIGPVAVERLTQSFGGTTIYVPKIDSVTGRRLAALLGNDAYSGLRATYGGSQLLIPNSGKLRREERNAAIWAEYTATEGLAPGGVNRVDALALRHGLTRRQIFHILKKFR